MRCSSVTSVLWQRGDQVIRVLPTTKPANTRCGLSAGVGGALRAAWLGETAEACPWPDLRRTTLSRWGAASTAVPPLSAADHPYDLRHAWAVRTIHIGLPDTVAARMMGHSVAIHTRTYHHWITRRDQQQAVDAARPGTTPDQGLRMSSFLRPWPTATAGFTAVTAVSSERGRRGTPAQPGAGRAAGSAASGAAVLICCGSGEATAPWLAEGFATGLDISLVRWSSPAARR